MAHNGRHFKPSQRPARRHAFAAWLTAFALLVQGLVPLGQALAFESAGGDFQVICTAQGVKTIAVDENGQPTDPQDTVACPFCLVHAPAIGVVPQDGLSLTFPHETLKTAFGVTREDRYASLWHIRPRLPRGPPSSL